MRISIVLAAFNGEKFIAQQLESIIHNSRPPDEIILIDDHSSDATITIAQKIISSSPAIKLHVHRNPINLGATRSFMIGAGICSGDIIFFSDQDDVWRKEKVEKMLTPFEVDRSICMVYSDGAITDARLRPTGRTIFSTRRRRDLHLGNDRAKDSLARDPDIKGCTMAVRSELIRKVIAGQGPDPFDHWGHDHWIALFAFGLCKVGVVNECLIDHRLHGNNTSAGMRFDPRRFEHLKKWIGTARTNAPDHDVRKYQLAIDHAKIFGPGFDPGLLSALGRMFAIAEQRSAIRNAGIWSRPFKAVRLYRQGIYDQHFNGIWSMLRDIAI